MSVPCPSCGQITVHLDKVKLMPQRNSVMVKGEEIILSKTLFELFSLLHRRMPNHASHEGIMTVLYSDRADPPYDAAVKMHIMKLRRLFKSTEVKIITVWGLGYRLEIP